MKPIVVVGSLNMDLVVRAGKMPGPGETLLGSDFVTIPGGKGANQAAAIGRLGGQVAMVGRVGSDDFGRALRQNLEAFQVSTHFVQTDPTAPTGVALIVVEPGGENRIIVVGGANRRLAPADIDAAAGLVSQAGLVVAQLEIPLETVECLVELARRCQVPVLLNAAPPAPLSPELLSGIHTLVVNEHEAALLSGVPVSNVVSARQAARALARLGVHQVALTLGPLGALLCSPAEEIHVPAFRVPVVDTTAAGDAFIGGLAVSLVSGSGSLYQQVLFANAAGALACTCLGAQSSLPDQAQVLDLLQTLPG